MEENNSMKQSVFYTFLVLIGLSIPTLSFAWDRIVTLNPMISEWTAEILGKEKALQKIVGASEYSHYPEWIKPIATVGAYPQVQIEKILSLKPDLVIGSLEYNRPDQIEKLKELKINIVLLPKESFLKMDVWILELGKILKEEIASKNWVQRWNQALQELKKPNQVTRAFLEIQYQPLITVGKNSFLNDSFKLIGFENIFGEFDQSYPKISKEAVLEKKPEVIFVFEMVKNHESQEVIRAAWKGSRVVFLSGDDFSRCSMRLLKALKEIK